MSDFKKYRIEEMILIFMELPLLSFQNTVMCILAAMG